MSTTATEPFCGDEETFGTVLVSTVRLVLAYLFVTGALLAFLLSSGCATIVNGTERQVSVSGPVDQLKIDGVPISDGSRP